MGYRGKIAERERARELRAEGWTMPDIAAELSVSRGSVSVWTRDIDVEPRPRRARSRGPNVLQRAKAAEIDAMLVEGRERIGQLSERDLLIAGTALYAGEGGKTRDKVVFANSDPEMVAMFCRWLRTTFVIDETRLRFRLYLHDGLDLESANQFWSELTGIPTGQFQRPYRAVADATRRSNKHEMGCASVIYCCSRTHRAISGLVGALLTSTSHIPG